MPRSFTWFTDSPDDGPHCTCLWCAKPILDTFDVEEDHPEAGPAIRMWTHDGKMEARFHVRCFEEAIKEGSVELKSPVGKES
jgi:hypothetical protein